MTKIYPDQAIGGWGKLKYPCPAVLVQDNRIKDTGKIINSK